MSILQEHYSAVHSNKNVKLSRASSLKESESKMVASSNVRVSGFPSKIPNAYSIWILHCIVKGTSGATEDAATVSCCRNIIDNFSYMKFTFFKRKGRVFKSVRFLSWSMLHSCGRSSPCFMDARLKQFVTVLRFLLKCRIFQRSKFYSVELDKCPTFPQKKKNVWIIEVYARFTRFVVENRVKFDLTTYFYVNCFGFLLLPPLYIFFSRKTSPLDLLQLFS